MLKKTFKISMVIIALFGVIAKSFGQQYKTNDKLANAIYVSMLKSISNSMEFKRTYIFNHKTSAHLLKNFEFKHPNNYAIDTSTIKIPQEFKFLLNNVDTSKIQNRYIGENLKKSYRKLKYNKKDHELTLIFSPIILSDNLDLAICSYTYYLGPEQSAGVMCYLRKINNKWVVVQTTRLYIS